MTSDRGDADHQHSAIPADEVVSLSKDEVFHILQNPRRRAILRYLLEHDDLTQFRLSDLAEELAAWEHDTTVRDLTSTQCQRVYIALYQSHLPKLDDAGLVEYNQARGTIKPMPLLHVFEPYLDDSLHDATDELSVADIDTDESDSSHGLADTLSDLFRE